MTSEIILFKLGEQKYGIEVLKVKEILTSPKITPLPNSAKFIRGLINVRGEVSPVIDLRLKFNISTTNLDNFIVITVKTSDERMMGVVVDEVLNPENIDLSELISVPEISVSIKKEFLKGLAQVDLEMIAIMDIDKVLIKEELE
jgi:purine-binding chemotaxis protein CheW